RVRVVPALGGVALADLGDTPVDGGDPAALDHVVGEYQAGIGDQKRALGHDVAHAAAAKAVTSTRRSAMTSRTSASCTIATIAVPRRLRSLISSVTTARLAASSDAVGSSSRSSG